MIDAIYTDTTSAAAAMKQATGLNKNDFMQLFVTQLQNQDPLNPQDSSEFIAQLAQLTQVEQAYNTNTALADMLSAFKSNATFSAVSFIGKEVEATGNAFVLKDGVQPSLFYNLDSTALNVKVQIKNEAGIVVRTMTNGITSAGDHSVAWDGKTDSGTTAAPGNYTFSVTGGVASGETFSGTPLVRGTVDGVRIVNGNPMLSVSNLEVALGDVTSVAGGN